VALLSDKEIEDPLGAVRKRLRAAAEVLARRQGSRPQAWDVYVERHVVGVRFVLHDPAGREVDLQLVPARLLEDG
jgi:hypothetical protein